MSETPAPAAEPAPTSGAAPPAPTPTVPAVSESIPQMSSPTTAVDSGDSPALPQPGATPVPPVTPVATAEPTSVPTTSPVEPEKPEPQNALTEKFTGYEWKALTEFRVFAPSMTTRLILMGCVQKLVPESLVQAYEKPEAKTTPITLWGVRIDPTNLVDARTSVVLMKFLRARYSGACHIIWRVYNNLQES